MSADVVVMATHGRSGLQRAFAGSVSQRVIAESPVPVLVLKPGGKRMADLQRLLVPVDGTPGGALALGVANALARSANARIDLLQVVQPLPLWMFGNTLAVGAAAYIDVDWEEASLSSAQTYVSGLAQRLRAAGRQVEGHAVKGQVVNAIERLADEVDSDLIVMSTHALTGPARAVLGSVADELVRTSNRPVLLVRRPDSALDASVPDEAVQSSTAPNPSEAG
jgi:nucleotide-binding universal stress UspA family protein